MSLPAAAAVSPHETSYRNICDFYAELQAVHHEFSAQMESRQPSLEIADAIARMTGPGIPGKLWGIPTLEAGAKDSYDNAAGALPDFSHVLNNIMDSSYDDQNRASIEVKVLRSLANLCGGTSAPEYMAACAQLHFFYNHFSRPSMILELEQEERAALFPKSTLLAIGRSPIINFNWEPDYQRSSSTEDRASRQHPHALKDPLQPLSLNSIPLESFAAALWSLSQFRTGHGPRAHVPQVRVPAARRVLADDRQAHHHLRARAVQAQRCGSWCARAPSSSRGCPTRAGASRSGARSPCG